MIICFITISTFLFSQSRIPRPEFQSDYPIPSPTTPNPDPDYGDYINIIVLIICLSLTSYFAIVKRSRVGIFWITVFSLIYFGFWRKGCICPVASIQNISLSLFTSGYTIPLTIIGLLSIPLIFALFFGRVFCASVCPIGAIQELVIIKHIKIPYWLNQALGIIPYVYLGLSVLAAATGAEFLISRFHPFLGFFRLSAQFEMIILGVIFLVAGIFIARPYCRFLCPYGALLRLMSKFSKWHLSITPDECIDCRLCEDSCPYGAIEKPTPEYDLENRSTGKRRLLILFVLVPILVSGGVFIGSRMDRILSYIHPTVRIAQRIILEDSGSVNDTTLESEAFRKTGQSVDDLLQEVRIIVEQFSFGGMLFGAFVGLMICLKLFGLSIWKRRKIYEVNRSDCLSCGRCFEYCPRDHTHIKKKKGIITENES